MTTERFGVSVPEEIAQKLEELVDECDDLGATRSEEIISAVLAAYFQTCDDSTARIREVLKRYRTEKNE